MEVNIFFLGQKCQCKKEWGTLYITPVDPSPIYLGRFLRFLDVNNGLQLVSLTQTDCPGCNLNQLVIIDI